MKNICQGIDEVKKKVLKVELIIIAVFILIVVVGVFLLLAMIKHRNKNYWKYAKSGRDIETKYTALGSYKVSYLEFDSENETIRNLKFAIRQR